ncbi:MAG: hypothetical protein IJX66_09040 [Lachnospiraceae bacterium]|nr:hypothetical protein [Lachnospiraceae bacterium]
MKKILECLKLVLHYFPVITVVVMIVSAGYVTFFWGADENVSIALLWQILLVSLICSGSPLFFCQRKPKEMGKGEFWFRWGLCYIYVNVVVLGFGIGFKWFEPSKLPMVIGMLLAIAIAFVIIAGFVFLVDMKTADAMNQKLKERNKES